MMASIRNRFGVWSVLGTTLVAATVACVSTPDSPSEPETVEAVLSEVRVDHEGETTRVSLMGATSPVYTTFERDEPRGLVVDLTDVPDASRQESVAVFDGLVEDVRVEPFETGGREHTRIEVGLSVPATHEVVRLDDRLEIRITALEEAMDPWADSEAPKGSLLGATSPAGAPPAMEDAPASNGVPATTLLSIDARESETGTVLELGADGQVDSLDAFVLADPARLVVDLLGVSRSETPAKIEVGSAHAARVRVGEHADKVRVVVDGGELPDPFTDFRTVKRADGVTVVLGTEAWSLAETDPETALETATASASDEAGPAEPEQVAEAELAESEAMQAQTDGQEQTDALEQAVAALAADASEEDLQAQAATPAEGGWTRVYGVQLDSQTERERVAVLSDAPVDYELVDVDADTVMVRLHGASIAPEATVRMAPEEPGPLSLVSAFQQPEMETPEVRVVMKRAAGLRPQVSQMDTMLFVDFPRGQSQAATLPVHRAEAAQAQASPASGKALARAQAEIAPAVPASIAPAALDPDSGIELLREGGMLEEKHYVGRRVSLDFKDVDIDDVLRLIAEVSDLNIIAGDEVEGKVTIRLVDVPWDQALDVILLTKGLGFVRVGSVLRIAPADVLKSEEEARLQERRAKEKLEDLVVKLQPVNYADVKEVAKMVKRLLSARGTVDLDQRTNTIILKDIKTVIDEATALIRAIDTQTPQVLIEAKIVEARLDFSREIGSTWAFGAQPFEDGFNPTTQRQDMNFGEDVVFHDNSLLTGFTDTFNHVQVANPITSVANGLLDLGAFILDEQFNLELRLEAAESNGDGKVISSPRVVTLDNRQAEIKQGVSIPFQTFENGDAQLEFIDAVLLLKVTPHITADQSIIMDVEVQRNAPDDSVQTPTGSPAIAKNEAKTETLVKDGQTLVIGGIYVIQKAERSSGVPFFKDIPILGAAFRNREVRDQRNELLIFMTPRVVVAPEVAS